MSSHRDATAEPRLGFALRPRLARLGLAPAVARVRPPAGPSPSFDRFYAVPFDANSGEVGEPRVVFEGPAFNVPGVSYAVDAAGRILILKPAMDLTPETRLEVVHNWSRN